MQFISPVFFQNKLRPSKLFMKRSLLYLVVTLFLLTLALTGPVYAQSQLNIDGFYTQIQSTSQWWDKIWQTTFLGLGASNVSAVSQAYDVMMQLVRLIAACILTVYITVMFSTIARDGLAAFQFMVRGLLVITLISYLFLGNGANFGGIAYAGKILFNRVNAAMLQANINGVSITNALTDQIVGSKAKSYLGREIKLCDAMPSPAVILPQALSSTFPLDEKNPELNPDGLAAVRRLNCYYRLKEVADDLREEAAKEQCFGIPGVNYACAATARFLKGYANAAEKTYTRNLEKFKAGQYSVGDALDIQDPVEDYILGEGAINTIQGIMYALQYFFANLQELILFLWALTAPVMAAYSIFPNSTIGGLLQWGVTYLSIILSQAYYLLIVGIYASLLQSSETSMLNDLLFPFVLGLGAWLIAAGLAAGGATIAVRSLTNAGITSIATVGSLGAMAVGGSVGGAIANGASSGARSVANQGATRTRSVSRV